MPTNVVKTPRDEHLWDKAKKIAEKAGRGGDYAYIMGIYKKMKGISKAYQIPETYRLNRIHGRVPSRERLELMKLAETPPRPFSIARLLAHDSPRFTIPGIVDGLGFDRGQENNWIKFLENTMGTSINELVMRQSIAEKCISDRLNAPLRSAILQRSLSYWRSLKKSTIQVFSVGDLIKSKYVKRWRDKDKWQYAYKKPESKQSQVQDRKLNRAESRRVVETFAIAKRKLISEGISEKEAKTLLVKNPDVARVAVASIRNAIPSEFIAREMVRIVKMNKGPYQDRKGNLFFDREGTIAWDVNLHGDGKKIFVIDMTAPDSRVVPKRVPKRVPIQKCVRTPIRPVREPIQKAEPTKNRNPRLVLNLEKAKYKKRWKGSDGKWRYQYEETKEKKSPQEKKIVEEITQALPGDVTKFSGKLALDFMYDSSHVRASQLSYGIAWADQTGRLGAVASKKVKALTGKEMIALVAEMANAGIKVANDVPRYLNNKWVDLEKAQARGGKYHRRIPKQNGKGYTYVYDEEKYANRRDAHTNGDENSDGYILSKMMSQIEQAGKGGCGTDQFKSLVEKYGSKKVGALLQKEATAKKIIFKKGKFYSNSGEGKK
jgi:hypothetical protein